MKRKQKKNRLFKLISNIFLASLLIGVGLLVVLPKQKAQAESLGQDNYDYWFDSWGDFGNIFYHSSPSQVVLNVSPGSFEQGSLNYVTVNGNFDSGTVEYNCGTWKDDSTWISASDWYVSSVNINPDTLDVLVAPIGDLDNILYQRQLIPTVDFRTQNNQTIPRDKFCQRPWPTIYRQGVYVINFTIPVAGWGPGQYVVELAGSQTASCNMPDGSMLPECGMDTNIKSFLAGRPGSSSELYTFDITPPPPSVCTIYVNSNINTNWIISGPDYFSGGGLNNGSGYTATPGSYTATFDDIYGYTKSITPSTTQNCPGDGSITFSALYTQQSSGATIVVQSDHPTGGGSWTISGPQQYTGSGFSAVYSSVSPGTYTIYPNGVPGFTVSVTSASTQTVNNGGTITFTLHYAPIVPPSGCTIVVNSNLPAANWTIAGPQNLSGSGATYSYPGVLVGSYTITPGAVSGYYTPAPQTQNCPNQGTTTFNLTYNQIPVSCPDDALIAVLQDLPSTVQPNQVYPISLQVTNNSTYKWYSGSAYSFRQKTGQAITPTYGQLPQAVSPGNSVVWSFSVTAPAVAGPYTLNMQMLHQAGWGFVDGNGVAVPTCITPATDTYFGQQYIKSFNVANPAGITFNITYTLMNLCQPNITSADNSVAEQITVNWNCNTSGIEQGFRVWRSPTSGGIFSQRDGSLPLNPKSYLDSCPGAESNKGYYYKVEVFTNTGPVPSAMSTEYGPVWCNGNQANLINSTLKLITVTDAVAGAQAYTTSTLIKNGNVLTFQITVINDGTGNANIQYVCVAPSANIKNIRNLAVVSGSGITNGGVTANGCSPGVDKLNISGTKRPSLVDGNWVIDFTADFASQTKDKYEVCGVNGTIYYTDALTPAGQKTVSFGPVLCKTGKGTSPNFREVAP